MRPARGVRIRHRRLSNAQSAVVASPVLRRDGQAPAQLSSLAAPQPRRPCLSMTYPAMRKLRRRDGLGSSDRPFQVQLLGTCVILYVTTAFAVESGIPMWGEADSPTARG